MQIDVNSLNAFWREIRGHLKPDGILAIAVRGGSYKWDVHKDGRIGGSLEQTALMHARFCRLLSENACLGVTLRSFTDRKHESGAPIKELRGYFVCLENNRLSYRKTPKNELFDAYCTDAVTGKPITPELAVEYCDDF